MRKCPYCARDIQDEAVVCRYCKLDVPLPAHLIGKQRCAHCAEWIPNSTPICPFCGRIASRPAGTGRLPKAADSSAPPKPDWLRRLEPPPLEEDTLKGEAAEAVPGEATEDRGWPFTGKRAVYLEGTSGEDKAAEALPDWLTGDQEKAHVSQRLSEAAGPPSREQAPRPKKEPPIDPAQAESASQYGDLRLATYTAEPVSEPLPAEQTFGQRAARAARNLIVISLAIGLVAAIVWIARPYLFGPPAQPSANTATPTAGLVPTKTATAPAALPTAIPEASPSPAEPTPSLPPALPTAAQPACLTWDQIKVGDEGKEVCVRGTIRRWFSTSAVPLVIVFSEEEGSFMLIDRVQNYPEAIKGACVTARGVVEIWSGVRPVLDSHGALTFCQP